MAVGADTFCTECGAEVPARAKFCIDCGAAIPEPTDVAADEDGYSNIETVLPDEKRTDEPDAPEPPSLQSGVIVAGKFTIDRIIGQGGMGTVYGAEEQLSGKPVALKVITQKYVGSEKAVRRLIDEGVTTREISHPNIVQIYDIGLHGSQPYIAMEYIDGTPLHVWRGKQMAGGKAAPVRVVGQIIKEILNGLEAAHAAGVVHRDLKPENIMLIGEPTEKVAKIKIVDFGIALATKHAAQLSTGTGLGTQLYMAPEQVRNANAAEATADLYSVSKIFYELNVGVLPSGHWQPPSGGRSDVPAQIDALIERGLKNNRDLRPQSAAEYRDLMIAGFNQRIPSRPDKTERAVEIEGAKQDLKNAYVRMLKTVPAWVWITVAVIVLGIAFIDTTEQPPECHVDNWGNLIC
ncbi:MAG: serine/threonine-protein kinase [Hyphomonadaceae bacterium]